MVDADRFVGGEFLLADERLVVLGWPDVARLANGRDVGGAREETEPGTTGSQAGDGRVGADIDILDMRAADVDAAPEEATDGAALVDGPEGIGCPVHLEFGVGREAG